MNDPRTLDLYLTFRSTLVDYATPIVGDRAGAEDVVQDAYLRLDLAAEPALAAESPVGYLFRIVRNLALDRVRRRGMEARHQDAAASRSAVADTRTPEDVIRWQADLRTAGEALAAMPDPMRRAFVMHRLDGRRLQDIADALDVSVATAHRLVRQAVVRLAVAVDPQDDPQ